MRKWLLWTIGIVTTLGLLFWIGIYLAEQKAEDYLNNDLNTHLPSGMRISVEKVNIHLFSSQVELSALKAEKHDNDSLSWEVKAEETTLSGIAWLKLIVDDVVEIELVKIHEPDFLFHQLPKRKSKKDQSKQNRPKAGRSIHIAHFELDRGKFQYDPQGPESLEAEVAFGLDSLRIDTGAVSYSQLFNKVELDITAIHYITDDSIYGIRLESVRKSSTEEIVNFNNFSISSNLSKEAFYNHFGWCKSMVNLDIPMISVSTPQQSDSTFVISSVHMESPKALLYKDKTLPWPDRFTELPQEFLESLNFSFRVDSLQVSNGEVKFELKQEQDFLLEIPISNIEGLISLQNTIRDSSAIFATASGIILGETILNAAFRYDFGEDHPFSMNARAENTDLKVMNNILRKSAGVKIEEGKLNALIVDMNGNKNVSWGSVDFRYDNLKLAPYDRETGEKKEVLDALTDILRALLFWKNNPQEGEQVRISRFRQIRDKRKAFPAQWIDGTVKGMIATVSKINPEKITERKSK